MRRVHPALACAVFFSAIVLGQKNEFVDQWTKAANSPGATLTMKETAREHVNGQTVVTYRLLAEGLPKNQHYILWTWILGSQPQAIADAFINPGGLIVNRLADPTHNISEDPIDAKVFAGLGEPKRFALTSDDRKLRVFASAIPFPLETTSGDCRLSVEMGGPGYTVVSIRGFGFQPGESLAIETTSGGDSGEMQSKSYSDGTHAAVLLPPVKGQKSGKVSFRVAGATCIVKIEFPWGEGSYKIQ